MGDEKRRPDWLRVKLGSSSGGVRVENLLKDLSLNTVCREANCPNRGECYSKGTATFMIMGKNCTRRCRFCNVSDGKPEGIDPREPAKVAEAVDIMGLRYVVVTSVTRDDLEDGGAGHFARTIEAIKDLKKDIRVEVLIPDLQGCEDALATVVEARPDVLNHNIETIPRLYGRVRAQAEYERSLTLLKRVKDSAPHIKTKSGIMLGLGETKDEVVEVLRDLREHSCDLLTMGQYLSPSKDHYPVQEYITPEEFQWYREKALSMGFEDVASSPLVRSSYKAWELFNDRKDGCEDTAE